jgi:predicted nucleotidyltransferase
MSIRTPFFNVEQFTPTNAPEDYDVVYYELNKFMKLIIEQNPNIVEILHTNGSDILTSTPAFELIRQSRGSLMTSKIAATTLGYAFTQLKRIKGHGKWINSPQPDESPKQLDFVSVVHNCTSHKPWNKQVPFDNFSALHLGDNIYGLFRDNGKTWRDVNGNPIVKETEYFNGNPNYVVQLLTRKSRTPDIIVKINVKQFKESHENWINYWSWISNRNPKRSALEEQFGYDTKHAMHLVRLLRMGAEALSTGIINVRRADATELLAIRAGKWTYDELIEYAEHMHNNINELLKTTALPLTVNTKFVANLTMQVQDAVWSNDPGQRYNTFKNIA